MRPGGGKGKGGEFERIICRYLSLWITNDKNIDLFWRSAMSGGRATIHGVSVRQCGDICAVAQEGYGFADEWFVECKHVKYLNIAEFFIKGTGELKRFWDIAVEKAEKHGRTPMIIAQQNYWPIIVVAPHGKLACWAPAVISNGKVDIVLFEEMIKAEFNQ